MCVRTRVRALVGSPTPGGLTSYHHSTTFQDKYKTSTSIKSHLPQQIGVNDSKLSKFVVLARLTSYLASGRSRHFIYEALVASSHTNMDMDEIRLVHTEEKRINAV
jgi:hypothetical protein